MRPGDADIRPSGLADLRAEQNSADRRMQSTLGGVHDMLEALVDRIGQVEDEVARTGRKRRAIPGSGPALSTASYAPSGPTPAAASAALNSMDATIREKPVFAPARPQPELRADKDQDLRSGQDPRGPDHLAPANLAPMRRCGRSMGPTS